MKAVLRNLAAVLAGSLVLFIFDPTRAGQASVLPR
jgi:hypothetical protein